MGSSAEFCFWYIFSAPFQSSSSLGLEDTRLHLNREFIQPGLINKTHELELSSQLCTPLHYLFQ